MLGLPPYDFNLIMIRHFIISVKTTNNSTKAILKLFCTSKIIFHKERLNMTVMHISNKNHLRIKTYVMRSAKMHNQSIYMHE
jgi:diaminopimelate epimerase